jgi:predicted NBD/HSP70 family sugar kinase
MKSLRSNDLKESNRISILKTIRNGSYSRSDISNLLGMSKPTVSAIVEELINEGLVCEKGHGKSTVAGGKRPILLELNKNAGLIVSVYFNNQWYEIALTDLNANIISYTNLPTTIHENYEDTFYEVFQNIDKLIRGIRSKGIDYPILACGVSLRGLVNVELGTLQYSSSIPQWKNVKVKDYLSELLGLPVFVESSSRASTYAEIILDRDNDVETLATVSVGHSIGTGVAIKNEVYQGSQYGAVTFSHTTILENGPLCICGNRGCWETLASIPAFLNELGTREKDLKSIDFAEALKMYQDGDPVVTDVLHNFTGYWLGVGIANILNVFNPQKLIIQGDIILAGEKLKRKIEEVAKSRALPVNRNANISFTHLADKVKVKGAAALVIKHFFSRENHRKIWTK